MCNEQLKSKWTDFKNQEKNKELLKNNDKFNYNNIKNLFLPKNFFPIYMDDSFLYLYKFNESEDIIEFVKIELFGINSYQTFYINYELYYNFLRNLDSATMRTMTWEKAKKEKIINTLKYYKYSLFEVNSGTRLTEYVLFKTDRKLFNILKVKINNDTSLPEYFDNFYLPKEIVFEILDFETETSEDEKEYINKYGLYTKREFAYAEAGLEMDVLKEGKMFLQTNGMIEDYFKWLEKENLEDSVDSIYEYQTNMSKKLKDFRPWKE